MDGIDTTPTSARGISGPLLDTESPPIERAIEASAEQADFRAFMAGLPISLSPAMIMALLQRRMNGLDSQIKTNIDAMEAQQANLTELQEKCQTILAIKAAAGADGSIDYSTPVTVNGVTKSVRDWVADSDIPVGEISHRDDDSDSHDLNYYSGAGLQAALESVQSEIKVVNQGSELRMMDIQSLMQQRSSEISLATNMLKSVQDGTDAIVRNIG